MQRTRWQKVLVLVLGVLAAGMWVVPSATSSAQQNIPAPATPLKASSTGYPVQQVQYMLKSFGYSIVVDGDYGQQTTKVVMHWQKANRLVVDGVVGSETWGSLTSAVKTPVAVKPGRKHASEVTTPATTPVDVPAVGGAPAQPTTPRVSGQYAPDGLSGCEEMNWYRINAGLPERFGDGGHHQVWTRSDGFGWRESKCQNNALSSNGCCGGYWQEYITSHLSGQSQYRGRIIDECGVNSMSDIRGETPQQKWAQACVTKIVYDISGESPWA